ncbi:MAG: HgcAB-associated protein HgcC [Candidatus Hermodarchaeota archaeon]
MGKSSEIRKSRKMGKRFINNNFLYIIMSKNNEEKVCCDSKDITSCCKVEAVVTVDNKGQILFPKELRMSAKLEPDDKMVAITLRGNTESPIIVLVKAEMFGDIINNFLGPVMKDLFK